MEENKKNYTCNSKVETVDENLIEITAKMKKKCGTPI